LPALKPPEEAPVEAVVEAIPAEAVVEEAGVPEVVELEVSGEKEAQPMVEETIVAGIPGAESVAMPVEEALETAIEIATPESPSGAEEEGEGKEAPAIEEEMPVSLDEIFALRPEVFDHIESAGDDEELEEEGIGRKKKSKKKKKFVEMEYDPDSKTMVVKKKHKRGGDVWDEDWKL
jgi:N utilization substance protein A